MLRVPVMVELNHCFAEIITMTQKGIKMSFDVKRMIKFEHNVGEKEKKYRLYGGAALMAISIFTASIALLLVGMVLDCNRFYRLVPCLLRNEQKHLRYRREFRNHRHN